MTFSDICKTSLLTNVCNRITIKVQFSFTFLIIGNSVALVKSECAIHFHYKKEAIMKFGEKIKQLRTNKGASQEETAKACGISRRTYIGYEQEGRYPRNREVYSRLADFFDVDQNYLLTEDENFVTSAAERYGSRGKHQAEQLVTELSGMFAGGELSEEDKDAVMLALQKAYWACKEDNKKYTPKKYRQKSES
jgi:transcriptional regulator with XRE-family HTH domain